jgi:SAM-dependent methyltransferase
MPNRYKDNVLAEIQSVLAEAGRIESAIDVGSGDGYYAARLMERGAIEKITPVEVLLRERTEIAPVLYDGHTLPFPDRSFELSYAVDVVHHSQDPGRTLSELARCTRRYLLLKDHTYSSAAGFAFLCMLDEIGNRRFGVPSIYRYQRDWSWLPLVEQQGFELKRLLHPARCEEGLLGRVVNRFQFVALWQRRAPSA